MWVFIPGSRFCSRHSISSSRAAEVRAVTRGTRGGAAATGGSQGDNLKVRHKKKIKLEMQQSRRMLLIWPEWGNEHRSHLFCSYCAGFQLLSDSEQLFISLVFHHAHNFRYNCPGFEISASTTMQFEWMEFCSTRFKQQQLVVTETVSMN